MVELVAVEDEGFFTRALGLNSEEVIEEVRRQVVREECYFFLSRYWVFFRECEEIS